jgi:eukaryotic-like serine/threonine-protein kinase
MDECLTENQLAELLSGTGSGVDSPLQAHLDRCSTCLTAVAAALRAGAPSKQSRFTIIRRLGAGGMGTVYEALDREHNTRVALKMLRHLAPENLLRFKREFRALQDLHHSNLVRLGELVAEDDRWSFTMELLEGVSFLEYVRPGLATPDGVRFDDARLRHGFRQLVHGLDALHAVGKIHRDVKPSNALVTSEGRVVVLDLGLVLDQDSEGDSTGGYALGTIAYMAPEQALGRRVGPAADWYAVGVLLYQALTGQLPFTGSTMEVAAHKQRGQPTAPRALVPAAPAALDDLCRALLDPDPEARPSAADILRVLGDGEAAAPVPRPAKATPFVGRGHELEVLARALRDTRQDRPVAVFVSGESGIGKSALVQRFADERRDGGTVVLVGRCYERESVPFKAVDGIVDALSRYLARLPAIDVAALLPREAALLARAFPVLARVELIAQAPPGFEVRDPQELRVRVFGALRELFARLADRRPIMLVVDDVHWADADSFALLAELFHPPDAPALLLLATVRGSASASERAHIEAARGALNTFVHELHLSRMTAEEARALAELLIARHPGSSGLDPAAVAEEANGHPLFIDELIRGSHAAAAAMRLDDALWNRIAQLEPAARAILQLVALSGGPLARQTAMLAAHIDGDTFESHLSLLRATNLIRTTGTSASDALEPYHDRVRAAVLAHTGADEARPFHRRLALALEAGLHADAEALALHWRETGEHERAAEYAAEAAARASRALAFDRAVQLLRLALQLRAGARGDERAVEHRLRIELGHALVNAGRGAEAGHVFLAAAEAATTADAFDLRRLASEQLMRSGHIDEGIGTLRTALRPLGVEVASTPGQTLRSLLIRRARVRLRGLRYRERDPRELPASTLTRIDFCWSLSACLSFVDPLLGSDLAALHLLLALRAGEPSRLVRAVASEAVYAASVGAGARAARLQARAREIAARVNQPYVSGVLALSSGMVSALLGRFTEGRNHMTEAQRIFRECATGVAWELDVMQDFELEVLAWMGRLDELRRRVPPALREAESLGDLYFSTSLRVGLANNLICLQRDTVDQARSETVEALRTWGRSGFHVHHYWNLYSLAQIDLYSGDGVAAHRRLVERWPQVTGSMMLRVPYFRIIMSELRARCALAAARQLGHRAPGQARGLLAEADRAIARLRRERVGWAEAHASLLAAGVAHLRSDRGAAIDHLTRAIDGFAAADMELFATAARHRRASLSDDPAAATSRNEATAWLTRHDVVAPARMIAMLTPAFATD